MLVFVWWWVWRNCGSSGLYRVWILLIMYIEYPMCACKILSLIETYELETQRKEFFSGVWHTIVLVFMVLEQKDRDDIRAE